MGALGVLVIPAVGEEQLLNFFGGHSIFPLTEYIIRTMRTKVKGGNMKNLRIILYELYIGRENTGVRQERW
nr:MAG TPA: hypothetical protein [Caudoviricetes sp.]